METAVVLLGLLLFVGFCIWIWGMKGWLKDVEGLEDRWRTAEEKYEDRRRRLIVDLAHAHDSDDLGLALEIWRRVYEEVGPETLVAAMDEAEERREYWFGARVDAALKESWSKFVKESWLASRGEFFELGTADWLPRSKRFVVEMADAHQGEDIGLAIEIWRGFRNVRRTAEEADELKRAMAEGDAFMRLMAERRWVDWVEVSSEDLRDVRMTPDMLVWVLEQAEERGELWLGSRVDATLKESWAKFVDESYVASRDDYITKLERGG